jgi:hypothetical protein
LYCLLLEALTNITWIRFVDRLHAFRAVILEPASVAARGRPPTPALDEQATDLLEELSDALEAAPPAAREVLDPPENERSAGSVRASCTTKALPLGSGEVP